MHVACVQADLLARLRLVVIARKEASREEAATFHLKDVEGNLVLSVVVAPVFIAIATRILSTVLVARFLEDSFELLVDTRFKLLSVVDG